MIIKLYFFNFLFKSLKKIENKGILLKYSFLFARFTHF